MVRRFSSIWTCSPEIFWSPNLNLNSHWTLCLVQKVQVWTEVQDRTLATLDGKTEKYSRVDSTIMTHPHQEWSQVGMRPSERQCLEKRGKGSGLVSMSAVMSSVGIQVVEKVPSETCSWMKWYLTSMCFKCEETTSSCQLHRCITGRCHRKTWSATVNEWNEFSFIHSTCFILSPCNKRMKFLSFSFIPATKHFIFHFNSNFIPSRQSHHSRVQCTFP